jgi:hypothetical protein
MSFFGLSIMRNLVVRHVIDKIFSDHIAQGQGDQIGQNFAIWVIFYGVGRIFI